MTERELLTAGLRELGVSECPSAADNLLRYSEILREKNKVMNLTAITDPTEIVTRHFLDCAALAPYMPQNGRVLDVGTGAGFPGMPLAILCPQTEFVLLDALRKRIDFLNEVITELGLTNVTAVHARAEDYARDNRGTFDLAVSRAVADLRVLSELALPMVKVGGAFLAMKAEDCTEEVETAANAARFSVRRTRKCCTTLCRSMRFPAPSCACRKRRKHRKSIRAASRKYRLRRCKSGEKYTESTPLYGKLQRVFFVRK